MARLENIDEFIKTGEQPNISSFRRPLPHHPRPLGAARHPPQLSGHRRGLRSCGRAWLCISCTARPLLPGQPIRAWGRRGGDAQLGVAVGQIVDVTLPADRVP
jgi:hypothetical protein